MLSPSGTAHKERRINTRLATIITQERMITTIIKLPVSRWMEKEREIKKKPVYSVDDEQESNAVHDYNKRGE